MHTNPPLHNMPNSWHNASIHVAAALAVSRTVRDTIPCCHELWDKANEAANLATAVEELLMLAAQDIELMERELLAA